MPVYPKGLYHVSEMVDKVLMHGGKHKIINKRNALNAPSARQSIKSTLFGNVGMNMIGI